MAYVHLALVGNIGSGKSDLALFFRGDHPEIRSQPPRITQELSRAGGIIVLEEAVQSDPASLIDFYAELKTPRTSVEIEEGFLDIRIRQQEIIQESQGFVIEERPPWEGAKVFVPALHDQGKLSDEDIARYDNKFKSLIHRIQIPTVIAYIRVTDIEVLKARIRERGRDFEKDISQQHLEALNHRYESLLHDNANKQRLFNELGFSDITVVEIDANTDFRDDERYFQKTVDTILGSLLKRRKMKIGFVGTHGTGKTYLVSRIHAELTREGINADIVKEVARNLPRGFEINNATTPEAQEFILREQINKEVLARLNSDVVVCDRITLDNYAYFVRRFGRREGVEHMLRYYLLQEPYDFIFKVPPLEEEIVDDRFRSTDRSFQLQMDILVDEVMARFMPVLAQAGTRYVQLKPSMLNKDNPFPQVDSRHRDPWVHFCIGKIMEKYRLLKNYGEEDG